MKLEIEIPDKYGTKLDELEEVDPMIRDQIEVEVLPQVLRIINDAHRQVQQQNAGAMMSGPEDDGTQL